MAATTPTVLLPAPGIPINIILLLLFALGAIIPLMIIALFFDIEFLITTNRINLDKLGEVNKIFSKMSKAARDIKEKFKEGLS